MPTSRLRFTGVTPFNRGWLIAAPTLENTPNAESAFAHQISWSAAKKKGRPWSRPNPFSLSADLDLDRVVLLGLAGVVAPAVEPELGVGGKRAIELEVVAGGGGLRCGEVHRGESCERQCDEAAFH